MIRLLYACFIFTLPDWRHFPGPQDMMIEAFMADNNISGMFVSVVKGDSVLYQKGFGVADRKLNIPVGPKTCMELGSISKAFTAEVIYELHNAHLIDINSSIIKYFPGAPDAWSNITVRHLLRHESGIQNYLSDPRFKAAEYFGASNDSTAKNFFATVSTDSMTRMFYSLPLEFSPGASWSYSNTGYYLLGKIAEYATGQKFLDLVRHRISIPLKMQQTKANELAFEEGCLATGYFSTAGGLRASNVLTSNYAFSAGAWATTGEDMIEYLKAIHEKALPSDKAGYDWRNIPENELPFTYEGGRFYTTYHGMKIISHNGGTPGFSSSWIYLVDKAISIIVLMNRQDYAAIDQLAWDVLAAFEPALKYPVRKRRGEEEEIHTRKVSELIKSIKTNTAFQSRMSKPLKIFMESEHGRGLWKWYFERGFPDKIYCVDIETINDLKAYRFRLPFSKKTEYRMTILMNRQNELVQVRWW